MVILELIQIGFLGFIVLFFVYPSVVGERKLAIHMSQAQERLAASSDRFRRMNSATLSILEDLERAGEKLNAQVKKVDEKNQELLRVNKELETYTYITSHDLRGPLRHIASYTELLYEKYQPAMNEETSDLMNRVRKAVVRMRNLLDGLTEFQKISTASRFVERVVVEDAIQRFCELFDEEIRSVGASITYKNYPSIAGSGVQVGQLFQNILENAIKYRRPDVAPRIDVLCEVKDSRAYFAVADNGRGIPEETIPSLFSIFRRYDPSNSVEGLGVGLAICKKIVEIHGGQMSLESKAGEGTTFKFDLPIWNQD